MRPWSRPSKIRGAKQNLNELKSLDGHRRGLATAHLISDLKQQQWLLGGVQVHVHCSSAAPIARHFHPPLVPVLLERLALVPREAECGHSSTLASLGARVGCPHLVRLLRNLLFAETLAACHSMSRSAHLPG